MPSPDEHDYKTDKDLSSRIDSDTTPEETTNPLKALFLAIGGLIALLSIFALLPMFFTYLSEGDSRAPSEIHPTDTASKRSGQNAYHPATPEK
ncbi:MAG: hypothetical protein PHO08_09205 [Methylococcales bacterium]|nr:hypothetical protein [Methylococcales bacterium]MDD5630686.1 hypothetical protein [Methylococcales bacterium]